MADVLVWESAGTGYATLSRGRARGRATTHVARPRVASRRAGSEAAAVPRRSQGRRIAWRRLAALTGDVLAVAVWAALVPGLMWLGAAAGF